MFGYASEPSLGDIRPVAGRAVLALHGPVSGRLPHGDRIRQRTGFASAAGKDGDEKDGELLPSARRQQETGKDQKTKAEGQKVDQLVTSEPLERAAFYFRPQSLLSGTPPAHCASPR